MWSSRLSGWATSGFIGTGARTASDWLYRSRTPPRRARARLAVLGPASAKPSMPRHNVMPRAISRIGTGSSSTPRRWPRSACLRQLALGGQQRLQIAEQRLAVAFGLFGRRPVAQGARKADERRCKLVASCRLGKALALLGGRDRDLQEIGRAHV